MLVPCTIDATPRVVPCAAVSATLRGELARVDEQMAQLDHARGLISGMLSS